MPVQRSSLTVPNAAAWSKWLAENAASSDGVWLTIARKGVQKPTSLTHLQAQDEALCHGWIDSQGRKRDEFTLSHMFTPRTTRSAWSKRNVENVERLQEQGRMMSGGFAAVAAAKADGRWDTAIAGAPADFLEALATDPPAQATWENLPKGKKYPIFYQLSALRTEKGRTKRIAALVAMLSEGRDTMATKRAASPEEESSPSAKKPNTSLRAAKKTKPVVNARSGRVDSRVSDVTPRRSLRQRAAQT